MKKVLKFILWGIVVLSLAAYGAYAAFAPINVETFVVESGDVEIFVTEQGFVDTVEDFILFPEAGGTITKTLYKKDDYVRAGDTLLEIDPSDYELEIRAREAAIKGYEAQIRSVEEEEANRKEGYEASIESLNAELLSIEGQRKAAEGGRNQTPSANEQIRLLELSIEQAELEQKFAEEEFVKIQALYETGAASKSELDAAEQALTLVTNSVNSLKEQLSAKRREAARETGGTNLAREGDREYFDALAESARAQIDNFRLNLEKDFSANSKDYYLALVEAEKVSLEKAEDMIEKCAVKSPVTGILLSFPAAAQSAAAPQASVATIRVFNNVSITTSVNTRDVDNIKVGDKVEIIRKLRDGDKSYTGVVSEISGWAEIVMSALGVEERRVNIKITPDHELPDLAEGYDVDVKFTVLREENRIQAPLTAVFKREGGDFVFKVVDGVAVAVEVSRGARTSDRVIITEGLAVGDVVITDPNMDGMGEGKRVASKA
ncbi:MAG: HlyD family efflux transporter periplasmic adaptor subunit [Oscillospiraceae bacterium]|nr:HlyD family efflux transporter periplasmic adaptor subunit [Oscillospiraceae bacterium]